MKTYENTKLLSENCMASRSYDGYRASVGNKLIQRTIEKCKITHAEYGQIILSREEVINLKQFLEEALKQEF